MNRTRRTAAAHDARAKHASRAGFSFIEILVVMGVIAVLAGLVLVVLPVANEQSLRARTQQLLGKTQSSLLAFKQQYSTFPPMELRALPSSIGDRQTRIRGRATPENEGAETKYQALTYRGFHAGAAWEGPELGNADGDRLDVAINANNDPELHEITDAYGHPLVYIPARNYAQTSLSYTNGEGQRFRVVAWRDTRSGAYAQPQGFQLFSVGPDGEPNTDDDQKAWSLD